jgi:alkylation response protein AidB-like acyl-CoA dehydrogenase
MPEHLSTELLALRERTQAFIESELAPREVQLPPGADTADVDAAARAEARRRAAAAGFFGMTQPREFGGSAADALALTVVREALAASNLLLADFVLGPAPGALGAATGELRTRYLEPLLRGEKAAGFAFTEPSGPDAGRQTYAEREGETLLVTGRKSYVSNGPFCDFYTVLVNVEAADGAPGGTAMLVVDRETPGLSMPRRFTTLDGSLHCELAFERAPVPASHVLGEVGGGMGRALGQIGEMRLAVAARAAGTAMWTVEHIREHITQPHRQGGRLGDREGVRRIFAEMMTDTYAARAVVYRTARLAASGADVMNEGSMAKVFATEAVGRVVDQAIQLVGGNALITGHPLERLYREVRSLRIAEGATDVLRLNIARGRLEFASGRV